MYETTRKHLRNSIESVDRSLEQLDKQKAELFEDVGRLEVRSTQYRADRADFVSALAALDQAHAADLPF